MPGICCGAFTHIAKSGVSQPCPVMRVATQITAFGRGTDGHTGGHVGAHIGGYWSRTVDQR
jgi:hypothetical protein